MRPIGLWRSEVDNTTAESDVTPTESNAVRTYPITRWIKEKARLLWKWVGPTLVLQFIDISLAMAVALVITDMNRQDCEEHRREGQY